MCIYYHLAQRDLIHSVLGLVDGCVLLVDAAGSPPSCCMCINHHDPVPEP